MPDYDEVIKLTVDTTGADQPIQDIITKVNTLQANVTKFSAGRISQSFSGTATASGNAIDRIVAKLQALNIEIGSKIIHVGELGVAFMAMGEAATGGAAAAIGALSGISGAAAAASASVREVSSGVASVGAGSVGVATLGAPVALPTPGLPGQPFRADTSVTEGVWGGVRRQRSFLTQAEQSAVAGVAERVPASVLSSISGIGELTGGETGSLSGDVGAFDPASRRVLLGRGLGASQAASVASHEFGHGADELLTSQLLGGDLPEGVRDTFNQFRAGTRRVAEGGSSYVSQRLGQDYLRSDIPSELSADIFGGIFSGQGFDIAGQTGMSPNDADAMLAQAQSLTGHLGTRTGGRTPSQDQLDVISGFLDQQAAGGATSPRDLGALKEFTGVRRMAASDTGLMPAGGGALGRPPTGGAAPPPDWGSGTTDPWQEGEFTEMWTVSKGGGGEKDPRSMLGGVGDQISRTAMRFMAWMAVAAVFNAIAQGLSAIVRELVQVEEVSSRISFIQGTDMAQAGEFVMAGQTAGAEYGIMPSQMRAGLPGAAAFGIDPMYGGMASRLFGVSPEQGFQQLQSAQYFTGMGSAEIMDQAAGLYRVAPNQSQELLNVMAESGMLSQMTGLDTGQMATALTMTGRELGTSPIQASTAMQRVATKIPDYMMPGFIEEMGSMDRGEMADELIRLGVATVRGGRQVQTLVELMYQLADAGEAGAGGVGDMVDDMVEAQEKTLAFQWDRWKAQMAQSFQAAPGDEQTGLSGVLARSADRMEQENTIRAAGLQPDIGIFPDDISDLYSQSRLLISQRKMQEDPDPRMNQAWRGGYPEEEIVPPAFGELSMATLPGMVKGSEDPLAASLAIPKYDVSYEYFTENILEQEKAKLLEGFRQEEAEWRRMGIDPGEIAGRVEDRQEGIDAQGGFLDWDDGRRYDEGIDYLAAKEAQKSGAMGMDFQWEKDISQGAFEKALVQARTETEEVERVTGVKFDDEVFIRAFKEGTEKYVMSNEEMTRTMQLLNNTLTGTWNVPGGAMPMIPFPTGYDVQTGSADLSGMDQTLGLGQQGPQPANFTANVQVMCTIDGYDVNAVVDSVRTTSLTKETRAYPASNVGTVSGLRAK